MTYEDEHIVVVNKPPLMASVADAQRKKGTLAQILTDRLNRRSSRRVPVGVVSRLDVETSGLIVFTRTAEAKAHLKEQFATRTAERTYLALVAGEASDTKYESFLVQHKDGKRKSTKNRGIGKWARTYVEVVEKLQGASLVRCRLETGRTHQIRIHLASIGHPLMGEDWYREPRSTAHRRQALHAWRVDFADREEPRGIESPLPPDLVALIDSLGLNRSSATVDDG